MKPGLAAVVLPVLILLMCSCRHENSSPGYLTVKARSVSFHAVKSQVHKKEDSVFFRAKILNLGRCPKDTTIRLAYFLVNKSKSKVRIMNVSGTCGCMNFDYKKDEILPNEEITINVNFKSGSIEGFFRKEVFVQLKPGRTITLYFYVSVV